MSKTKRRIILAALLAVCLTAELVACTSDKKVGDDDTKTLDGKYVIVDVINDPDGATFDDLDGVYRDVGRSFADYAYLEFFESGKYEFVLFGETEADGAYAIDGKTLTLNANGDTIMAEITDSKISLDYWNGATLVFEKK